LIIDFNIIGNLAELMLAKPSSYFQYSCWHIAACWLELLIIWTFGWDVFFGVDELNLTLLMHLGDFCLLLDGQIFIAEFMVDYVIN
jgi:hypothetical protein